MPLQSEVSPTGCRADFVALSVRHEYQYREIVG